VKLKKRINDLEKILEEKNNTINNLTNENKNLLKKINQLEISSDNKIKEFKDKLEQKNLKITESNIKMDEKDKIIKQYELKISKFPFELSSEEVIMSIAFITFDESLVFPIICKNTDIFKFVENKFYEKYSEYKNLDNYFISNGKKINKDKSLDENNINNNDIITIFIENKNK